MKLTLKSLLVAAALAAAITPVKAGGVSVPVQFQGIWFDAGSPRRINLNSIEIGTMGQRPCQIVSAKPDSTLPNTTISIAWKCPEWDKDATPVEVVWILSKVAGREVMMQINTERPEASALLQRESR